MISLCYLKSQMGVKELSGYLKLSPLLVRGDFFAFLEQLFFGMNKHEIVH